MMPGDVMRGRGLPLTGSRGWAFWHIWCTLQNGSLGREGGREGEREGEREGGRGGSQWWREKGKGGREIIIIRCLI